jgi:shikimate kinase
VLAPALAFSYAPAARAGASQAPRAGAVWISLIGFMASGKSAVARVLGEGAKLTALDLDAEIERAAGRTVPAIFAAEGVSGFRERERRVLAGLPPQRRLVVATGGGIVETPECVARLRRHGVVLWFDAPWEVVRARLESDGPQRPLLAHLGWEGLARLYARRLRLYAAAADFRLRSDLESPSALARVALARALFWRRHRWKDDPCRG